MIRPLLAATASLVLAVGLLMGLGTAVPDIAFACSCVGPQPIEAYATEENVILAGEVVEPDGTGVRLGVEQWFSGEEPAAVVRIAGDFENGGMCGLGFVPDEGSRWVGVAWRPPSDDPLAELSANENLQVSICQPFMDLESPEGQALFDEAVATFGNGAPLPDGSDPPARRNLPVPAAPAAPTAAPVAAPEVDPGAPTGPAPEAVAMVAVGAVITTGVLVLAVVAFIGMRRRPTG